MEDLSDLAAATAADPTRPLRADVERFLATVATFRAPVPVDAQTVRDFAAYALVAVVDWLATTDHPVDTGRAEAIRGTIHTTVAALLAAGVVVAAAPPTRCPVPLPAGLAAIPPDLHYQADQEQQR